MSTKKFERYILIEPNLIKLFGHVIEFPLAFKEHFEANGIPYELVGNKQMDKEIINLFPNIHKTISATCFENLKNDGKQFYEDLNKIDNILKLNKKNLVIILTSYLNEVRGVGKYLSTKTTNLPTIALLFHQFIPPEKNFLTTLTKKYREKLSNKISSAFEQLKPKQDNIFFFTTPSGKLNLLYRRVIGLEFGTSPLPYRDCNFSLNKKLNPQQITFGFLGDGRFEKGLLLVLETIKFKNDFINKYIIQMITPRGYPDKKLIQLNEFIKEVKKRKNVNIIDGPLSPTEYLRIFKSIDVLLLPYHPKSYDARVSGIFIEGVLKGKLLIAPYNTWLASEIKKLKTGECFKYKSSQKETVKSIIEAMNRVENKIHCCRLRDRLKLNANRYRKYHCAKNFIKELERRIG